MIRNGFKFSLDSNFITQIECKVKGQLEDYHKYNRMVIVNKTKHSLRSNDLVYPKKGNDSGIINIKQH